jgi:Na+-transporting NADH:ubiquinone oxidoreductase subunit E
MGIGFQSFGGMLTGGGEEAPVEAENSTVEVKEALPAEDTNKVNKEIDEKEISYNDVKK